jgi:ABC-type protease/lipase transport system fused ATPase/permease subunit
MIQHRKVTTPKSVTRASLIRQAAPARWISAGDFGTPQLIIHDNNKTWIRQEEIRTGGNIQSQKRGAALVIVGHRPSTLAQADKILVLRGFCGDVWAARDVLNR